MTAADVESVVTVLRGTRVILDADVASLYGVETKRINEAVRNNPDKFPAGYIMETTQEEWMALRSKISSLEIKGRGKFSKYCPKAFTEKGLYMLATIIKSPRATQTTLSIIETFAKIKELTRAVSEMGSSTEENRQKSLMQKSGEILADILDDNLSASEAETTIELNLAVLKVKHVIKRKKE